MWTKNAYCGPADGVLHEASQEVRVAGRNEPELLKPDAVRLRLPATQSVRADHTVHTHSICIGTGPSAFLKTHQRNFFEPPDSHDQ